MIRRSFIFVSMIMVISTTGCVKETYDMNTLAKGNHISPTLAISAVKGDITLNDIDKFKSNENVFIDPDNFVHIVYRKDSIVDLSLSDFHSLKSMIGFDGNDNMSPDLETFNLSLASVQLVATLVPYTLSLGIEDILSHLSGDIHVSNPSIKLVYSNSFLTPVQIALNATGRRDTKTVALNLAPFTLKSPAAPYYQEADSVFVINKDNSSISALISMPPEEINFSGTATLTISGKNSQAKSVVLGSNRLIGSIEVDVPLDLRVNNLQFTDTVNNFIIKDDKGSPIKPENFEFMRVDIRAKNGFPFGVSLGMSLYDSNNNAILGTVNATDILEPAPVDTNGKVAGSTETLTNIEFTSDFLHSIPAADKIIFHFTLSQSDVTQDVKIYSDYRIDFNAALVVKPDIKLK